MVKAVTLFLVLLAVLALFGRLRFPALRRTADRLRGRRAPKCPSCGTPVPGGGRCVCGRHV